jgi:hypothetical protein
MRNPATTRDRQAKTAKKVESPKARGRKPSASKASAASATSPHPKYEVMIANAIIQNKHRSGSSLVAITKYIVENYKIPEEKLKIQLRIALKRAVTAGKLRKNKASYKIADRDAILPKPKKVQKKPTVAKPPTKETKAVAKPKTITKKAPSVTPKSKSTTASRTSAAKKASPPKAKTASPASPKKKIEKKTVTKKPVKMESPKKKAAPTKTTSVPAKRGRKPKAVSTTKKTTS